MIPEERGKSKFCATGVRDLLRLRKVNGGRMMKLCEVTGLTYADMAEIIAFFFGLNVAGVFAGNVCFWILKEFLEMAEVLINSLFSLLFKR